MTCDVNSNMIHFVVELINSQGFSSMGEATKPLVDEAMKVKRNQYLNVNLCKYSVNLPLEL